MTNLTKFRIVDKTDDFRASELSKEGGFPLDDEEVLNKFRTAFKDLIKQAGRMLLSGKMELYRLSFPIKYMSSKSILYAVSLMTIHTPIYFQAAALTTDPVERMKYVIV